MNKNSIEKPEFLGKFLFQATVSDLVEAFRFYGYTEICGRVSPDTSPDRKHYVYGLAGLSKLLGCSLSTAQRIKASGILDSAIAQHGRIIIVDADLALELMKEYRRQN